MIMQFEHIATRVPLNIKLSFRQNLLFKLGFKNKVIDEVMDFIGEYDYFYEGVR
jgi:hypothetical protein|tara:strand:+ start:609 stop:770 length:162 start_codon:yes stop_codon:yes gene_type:complete